MLEGIHVMGVYWCEDEDLPTPLGELIASAKDDNSATAVTRLQGQLSEFVRETATSGDVTGDPADTMVVAVPNGNGGNRRLVPALAKAVADALGASVCDALTRSEATVRLRDTPPQQRPAVVRSAGYEVTSQVDCQRVVLVDDVVLTGTTLRYLARLLHDAGAAKVIAIVAAQTRRADQ